MSIDITNIKVGSPSEAIESLNLVNRNYMILVYLEHHQIQVKN